jgi:hypothetical protein
MAHQSATYPVIAAVGAALNVSGFTGCVPGKTVTVVNDPAQALAAPFTAISVVSETRLDTMGLPGKSILLDLDHWSTAFGDIEVALMRSKAIELLHYQSLTIEDHTLIAVQYDEGRDFSTEEKAGVRYRRYNDTFRIDVQQTTP